VGLAVTVLLLAWALHDVSLAQIAMHVRQAHVGWLLVAVVTATLTFPLRTIRWQLILRGDDGRRLPFGDLWHAVAIGFMANNLLPARAGEFARAYVASRRLPVRFTTALASIGVERVFDGLIMVAGMAIAIAAPTFPAHATVLGTPLSRVATGAAALFSGLLVFSLLVVHYPTPWLRLLDRTLHAVLPARLAERALTIAEGIIAGLEVLKQPGRFAGVVAWSCVLWGVNAASFAICFRAFDLPIPPAGALLLQGVIGFGVAVPSSPGFVGVFEAATRLTLSIYAISPELAVGYALTYHATTLLPITILGFASLSRTRLHLAELRSPAAAER